MLDQHFPLLLSYLVPLRILNALSTNTFFQPDEFFQLLEPAHRMVYGYGQLTWEWEHALRAGVVPWVYAQVYRLGDALGLGSDGVMLLPKVFGGVVAAVADVHVYRFALRILGSEMIARWALLLSVTSAWNWFMATRSFSNSLEAALTAVALAYWPWGRTGDLGDALYATVPAALSVVVRPSNGAIWAVLACQHVADTHRVRFLVWAGCVGVAVVGACAAVDHLVYNAWVFPWLNFLRFNVTLNLLVFYGTAPWHFYLTQALPLLTMGTLPAVVFGVNRHTRPLAVVVAVVVALYLFIPHKEFRFLYPLVPLLLYIGAIGFAQLQCSRFSRYTSRVAIATVLFHLAVGVWFTQVQERGVMDVMQALRADPDVGLVGFLTPCHSTPLHSHLHRPDLADKVWGLSCEPPVHLMGHPNATALVKEYADESDDFYANPKQWLRAHLPPPMKGMQTGGREWKHQWPTHLVFFEHLEPTMKQVLDGSKYEQCYRFFNGYWHWDSRRTGSVVVYCKWPWE